MVYLAPLLVAPVTLFGFMLSAIGLPQRRRALMLLDLEQQRIRIEQPYDVVALFLFITGCIVGIFYCLDTLYGERRDRSILFWKSLPVSDRTTVLAKATVPLAVLPSLVFVITLVTQVLMLVWTNMLLLFSGMPLTSSAQLPMFQQAIILFYGLLVLTLWHAPLYAWLLLISAWAPRATYLWALLPLAAICVFEKIAFNSLHLLGFLKYRLIGGLEKAFSFDRHGLVHAWSQFTPGRFLASPGLWLGLVSAAAFLAASARIRRNREPI